MPQKQTTGTTISRLGALTVMLNNQAPQEDLAAGDRVRMREELDAILAGDAGVPRGKVAARSMQRCIAGGGLLMINGVGIFGAN